MRFQIALALLIITIVTEAQPWEEKWHYLLPNLISASPTVAKDGTTYVSAGNFVIAIQVPTTPADIKAKQATQKWSHDFTHDLVAWSPNTPLLQSSPVLSLDGKYVFIAVNSGSRTNHDERGRIFALNSDTGNTVWETDWNSVQLKPSNVLAVSVPKVDPSSGTLWVASLIADQPDPAQTLFIINQTNGIPRHPSHSKKFAHNPALNFAQWEPAVDGAGSAVIVSSRLEKDASPSFKIASIHENNVQYSWETLWHSGTTSIPAIDIKNRWIYVSGRLKDSDGDYFGTGFLFSFDKHKDVSAVSARHTWKIYFPFFSEHSSLSVPVVSSDGTIYLSDAAVGYAYAINTDSTPKWTKNVNYSSHVSMSYGYVTNSLHQWIKNLNYLSGPISGFSDATNKNNAPESTKSTVYENTAVRQRPAIDNEHGILYLVTDDAVVYALNAETGETKWKSPIVATTIPVVAGDGSLVIGAGDTVLALFGQS